MEGDGGATSKGATGVFPSGGVENPVRLEPFDDVVMTGYECGAGGVVPAKGFGKGEGGDAGYLTVDNGGEFVDDGKGGRIGEDAGKAGTELFAI